MNLSTEEIKTLPTLSVALADGVTLSLTAKEYMEAGPRVEGGRVSYAPRWGRPHAPLFQSNTDRGLVSVPEFVSLVYVFSSVCVVGCVFVYYECMCSCVYFCVFSSVCVVVCIYVCFRVYV